MTSLLRGLALALLAVSAAQAGTSYDLGQGSSSTTLRLTGPLRLVGSRTTLATPRFDADPVLGHVKKSSANATVEWEVTKFGVVNSTTQPAARWTRTTNLSVGDSANTIVTYPNRDVNTQSLFAVSHATVPTGGDGLYLVKCAASFASNATGRRTISVYKNGGAVVGSSFEQPPLTGVETPLSTSSLIHAVAADTIGCNVFQTSGGGLNVASGSIEIVKLW